MATWDEAGEARARLERQFPGLKGHRYTILSKADARFNCVAWTLGRPSEWWWPSDNYFWPVEPREATLGCFLRALETFEFRACASGTPEVGYEKIALYAIDERITHVAKIVTAKVWSSKLGRAELISHPPDALNSDVYGKPAYFFRRRTGRAR